MYIQQKTKSHQYKRKSFCRLSPYLGFMSGLGSCKTCRPDYTWCLAFYKETWLSGTSLLGVTFYVYFCWWSQQTLLQNDLKNSLRKNDNAPYLYLDGSICWNTLCQWIFQASYEVKKAIWRQDHREKLRQSISGESGGRSQLQLLMHATSSCRHNRVGLVDLRIRGETTVAFSLM